MFLQVLAHLGSPVLRAVEQLCVCVFESRNIQALWRYMLLSTFCFFANVT